MTDKRQSDEEGTAMLVPVLLAGGQLALAAGGLTSLIVPAYAAAFCYAYRSASLWAA